MRLTIPLVVLTFVTSSGCARPAAGPPSAPPTATQPSEAPKSGSASAPAADATADADYYRERAAALAKQTADEIGRTDFARFRRGRLHAAGVLDSANEVAWQKELTTAFEQQELPRILDVTAKILGEDPADIRAHMLRAVALRKAGRIPEADFHRDMARGLIESIAKTGNGNSIQTAWTVYRVEEEYEILKVLGCVFMSQALMHDGKRAFDVLEARKLEGGETVRVYFDVTEILAEEQRAFSPKY